MKIGFVFVLFLFINNLYSQTVIHQETVADYICNTNLTKKSSIRTFYPYVEHGKTEYFKGNTLIRFATYRDGVLDGAFQDNFCDGCCFGKVESKGVNKDGKYNGIVSKYACKEDKNGKCLHILSQELSYDEGSLLKQTEYDYEIFNKKYKAVCEKLGISDYMEVSKEIIINKSEWPKPPAVTQYYSNGNIAAKRIKSYEEVEIYYKNGKLALYIRENPNTEGEILEFKKYNKNGKLIQWEEYGVSKFYANGQIKQSGDSSFYESGKIKTIKEKEFYENGKLMSDGKISYYENGQIKSDGTNRFYEDGKPEYTKDELSEKSYNKAGLIVKQKTFSNGEYKEWYDNGKLKLETIKNKDNKIDGVFKSYSETGDIIEIKYYKNGDIQTIKDIYNQFLSSFGNIKKSEWITYADGTHPSKYEPNKPTKLLYQKGNDILLELCSKYDSETNSKTKNDIFSQAAEILKSMLNLSANYTDEINSKVKKSNSNEDFKGFLFYSDSIEIQSKQIKEQQSKNETNYKNSFSVISKNEYKSVITEIEAYDKTYYSELKFKTGKSIISKLAVLNKNYDLLQKQKQEIDSKVQEFNTKYQDNKPNKQLYKKGNKLLEEWSVIYEKEGDSTKKLLFGNSNNLPLLNKLISLANVDNTDLNIKIKEANTSDEIKKILGL